MGKSVGNIGHVDKWENNIWFLKTVANHTESIGNAIPNCKCSQQRQAFTWQLNFSQSDQDKSGAQSGVMGGLGRWRCPGFGQYQFPTCRKIWKACEPKQSSERLSQKIKNIRMPPKRVGKSIKNTAKSTILCAPVCTRSPQIALCVRRHARRAHRCAQDQPKSPQDRPKIAPRSS